MIRERFFDDVDGWESVDLLRMAVDSAKGASAETGDTFLVVQVVAKAKPRTVVDLEELPK